MRGACHCGRVTIEVPSAPAEMIVCNCSQCWQRGALWAYYPASRIAVEGSPAQYRRADIEVYLTTDFCPSCGITVGWTPARAGMADRAGVNMRLFAPSELHGIAIRYVDGRHDDDGDRRDPLRAPTRFDASLGIA